MERRVISLSAQLRLQPPGPQRALSLLVFRVSLEFRVRKSLRPGIWGLCGSEGVRGVEQPAGVRSRRLCRSIHPGLAL